MKRSTTRKKLMPGMTTSYKTPVVKGNENKNFYTWLNNYDKYGYKSINQLITEALKLKYIMDNLKLEATLAKDVTSKVSEQQTNKKEIKVVDVIDIDDVDDFGLIENTFASIKR